MYSIITYYVWYIIWFFVCVFIIQVVFEVFFFFGQWYLDFFLGVIFFLILVVSWDYIVLGFSIFLGYINILVIINDLGIVI